MPKKSREHVEDWECWYCGATIGEYPRCIIVKCPVCGEENVLPGHDSASKEEWIKIQEIEKRARKYALEKYRAMREH